MATEVKNSGSGTWQVPIGQECTLIEGWGAGGGGGTGGGGPGEAGSGGGGGGYFSYTPGAPIAAGTNINYSVGTGGAGYAVASNGGDGIAGGATTVSTYSLTANGGGAGKGVNSGGASGGTASGGTTNTTGGTSSNPGGSSGTTGGAGANGGSGGSGGGSNSPSGGTGTAPGGGGGGGGRHTTGGNGAAGRIVFTYSAASSGPTFSYTGQDSGGGLILGGTSSASTGSSLRVNLGAFWNLDETSGNRADSSYHANTLTDTNSVSYAVGKQGNGATFVSASSQHLSIADNSSLTLGSTDFSISLWVKFNSLVNNGLNDYLGIISKGGGGAAYSFSIQYRPLTAQLQLQIYNGGTTYALWASTFGAMTIDTWYHVIVAYRDSNKATSISVNGTENTGTSTVALTDSSYGFSLGRAYYSNTYNSNSEIDCVGYWKKVLSSTEKTALYLSGYAQNFPFESGYIATYPIAGGVVLGGSASTDSFAGLNYTPTGGVSLGGTSESIAKSSYSYTTNGGLILGGDSSAIWFTFRHRATGRLILLGESNFISSAYQKIMKGGLQISNVSLLFDLKAWYKLEEASGARYDSHLYAHDLTENNNPSNDVGISGNACSFTQGSNTYLSLDDTEDFSYQNQDFSMSCWVYLNSKTTPNSRDSVGIISKQGVFNAQREYLLEYRSDVDKFVFSIGDNLFSTYTVSSDVAPNIESWYFIYCGYKHESQSLFISVNNEELIEQVVEVTPFDGNNSIEIGRGFGSDEYVVDGLIDSVGFWQRSLNETERSNLYRGGESLEYPFDSFNFSYLPDSGLILGGTANYGVPNSNYTMSGVLTLGGESGVSARYVTTMTGELEFSGQAIITLSDWYYQSSSGLLLYGVAPKTFRWGNDSSEYGIVLTLDGREALWTNVFNIVEDIYVHIFTNDIQLIANDLSISMDEYLKDIVRKEDLEEMVYEGFYEPQLCENWLFSFDGYKGYVESDMIIFGFWPTENFYKGWWLEGATSGKIYKIAYLGGGFGNRIGIANSLVVVPRLTLKGKEDYD